MSVLLTYTYLMMIKKSVPREAQLETSKSTKLC